MPPLPPADSGGQTPGQQAVAVALQQLNKPYVYGATGPDSFDCSGLMMYAYQTGPGISIGRDTTAQWNNSVSLTTIYDNYAVPGTPTRPTANLDPNMLEQGDLLLYFSPGNSGAYAHVKMYIGGGQTVEAPHTGDVVKKNPVDLVGDSSEPFHGVKRPTGEAGPNSSTSGGAGAGAGNSGSGNSNTGQGTGQQLVASGVNSQKDPNSTSSESYATEDLPDPRNNLPFSQFFMGQTIPAGIQGPGVVSPLGTAGQSGSFQFTFSGNVGNSGSHGSMQLVRGGMIELPSSSSGDPTKANLQYRKGGQFACYFMMNPSSVTVDCDINTDAAAPSQVDPSALANSPYWVQNQTITLSLIFNRMYEVWMGNIPGPSDIGCRWDIRAIERLMGIYDAKANYPGTKSKDNVSGGLGSSLGNYGAGDRPPQALPVQVYLGGPNSYDFQGLIGSFSYTYTLFDMNMVPIECTVDLSIMRQYLPSFAVGLKGPGGADLVTPMVSVMGQTGTKYVPPNNSTFNGASGLNKPPFKALQKSYTNLTQ